MKSRYCSFIMSSPDGLRLMLMFATLQHCSRKHIIKNEKGSEVKSMGGRARESEIAKGGAEAASTEERGHVRTAALRHCCNLCAACSSCLTHFSLSPVKWDSIIFNIQIIDILPTYCIYLIL